MLTQAVFVGLFRHVLQLAAGALVARGFLDNSMAEQLVGGAVAVTTAVWFAVDRARTR